MDSPAVFREDLSLVLKAGVLYSHQRYCIIREIKKYTVSQN
jgi:hypothetical protein